MCAVIENMILEYAHKTNLQITTEIWYSGEKLRDYLAGENHLDILFLDIELR